MSSTWADIERSWNSAKSEDAWGPEHVQRLRQYSPDLVSRAIRSFAERGQALSLDEVSAVVERLARSSLSFRDGVGCPDCLSGWIVHRIDGVNRAWRCRCAGGQGDASGCEGCEICAP
jgi:hypothetical protein